VAGVRHRKAINAAHAKAGRMVPASIGDQAPTSALY